MGALHADEARLAVSGVAYRIAACNNMMDQGRYLFVRFDVDACADSVFMCGCGILQNTKYFAFTEDLCVVQRKKKGFTNGERSDPCISVAVGHSGFTFHGISACMASPTGIIGNLSEICCSGLIKISLGGRSYRTDWHDTAKGCDFWKIPLLCVNSARSLLCRRPSFRC